MRRTVQTRFSSCFSCSICLAVTSMRSLSRTTLSCACTPLVTSVLLEPLPVDYGKESEVSITVWAHPEIAVAIVDPHSTFLSTLSLLEHTDVTSLTLSAAWNIVQQPRRVTVLTPCVVVSQKSAECGRTGWVFSCLVGRPKASRLSGHPPLFPAVLSGGGARGRGSL